MVPLSDWNAIEESMLLLSPDASRSRLLSAIEQLESGKGETSDLIEP